MTDNQSKRIILRKKTHRDISNTRVTNTERINLATVEKYLNRNQTEPELGPEFRPFSSFGIFILHFIILLSSLEIFYSFENLLTLYPIIPFKHQQLSLHTEITLEHNTKYISLDNSQPASINLRNRKRS